MVTLDKGNISEQARVPHLNDCCTRGRQSISYNPRSLPHTGETRSQPPWVPAVPSDTNWAGIQIILNIDAGISGATSVIDHVTHIGRLESPPPLPELQKCRVCKATHVRLAQGSLQKCPVASETREGPLSLQLAPCFLQVRGGPPGSGAGARMSHCKHGTRGHGLSWVPRSHQPGNRVSSLETKSHNMEQFCSATRARNRAFVWEISQNVARNTLNLLPYPKS